MDRWVFFMYILWVMTLDTMQLDIGFSAKGCAVLGKSWCGQFFHEDYGRLYFIRGGQATIRHNDQEFGLVPGRLYLIPPRVNMAFCCPRQFEVAWVHFTLTVAGENDLLAPERCRYVDVPADADRADAEMLQLLELLEQPDLCHQLRARGVLLSLLSGFFHFESAPAAQVSQQVLARLTPVLEYIDNHLHERILLSELAAIASYETSYFATLFKTVFSLSPGVYIRKQRVRKAQVLLQTTPLSLAAIADRLAFSDAFHFSRTFKKVTGESPSRFRQRQKVQVP